MSGNLSIIGIWTGAEQKRFQAVLNGFKKLYPHVTVKYTSGGDNTPTILSTAIAGGKPPDLASIGQPGLLQGVRQPWRAEVDRLRAGDPARNYTADWLEARYRQGQALRPLLQGGEQVDGLVLDSRIQDSRRQGRRRPGRQLLAAANTLRGVRNSRVLDRRGRRLDADRPVREHLPPAGRPGEVRPADGAHDSVDAPVGEGGAADDGDRSSRSANIVRRHLGRAADGLPDVRQQRLEQAAEGRDGDRGRLRPGRRDDEGEAAIKDYNVFKFPSIGGSPPAVVGGGDIVVMFKDSPASRALVKYLATPAAATIAAKYAPGYSSPNKNVKPSAYSDAPQPRDGDPARARKNVPLRPLRPRSRPRSAGPSGRASSSCSRTSSRTRPT